MPKRPPSAKTKRKRKPNSAAATADKIASDNDALAALRGKIDAVDEAIQRLIAERAQFAKEVGIVKGLTSQQEDTLALLDESTNMYSAWLRGAASESS
jgi:hypothetical protein